MSKEQALLSVGPRSYSGGKSALRRAPRRHSLWDSTGLFSQAVHYSVFSRQKESL